jgi:hypothetical protein
MKTQPLNKRVTYYDDIISEDVRDSMYEWSQSVPYYAGFAMADADVPKFDFIPNVDDHKVSQLARRALYRHPVASTMEEFNNRNDVQPIRDLWDQINNTVFGGRASWEDGIPEGHPGLIGPDMMFSDPAGSYANKYNLSHKRIKTAGWTMYLNARAAIIGGRMKPLTNQEDVDGAIHRDTSNDKDSHRYPKTGMYTVLYVVNKHWLPSWRGEVQYFGEEDSGETHWKRGWNLGFPDTIVGNKPGRVIIQESEATHTGVTPTSNTPEMALRMAFRVKVTPDANGDFLL